MSENGQLEEVNRSIRSLAAKLDPNDVRPWEFVCECGESGCSERVGLSLALYDRLRSGYEALLAPGHRRRNGSPVVSPSRDSSRNGDGV